MAKGRIVLLSLGMLAVGFAAGTLFGVGCQSCTLGPEALPPGGEGIEVVGGDPCVPLPEPEPAGAGTMPYGGKPLPDTQPASGAGLPSAPQTPRPAPARSDPPDTPTRPEPPADPEPTPPVDPEPTPPVDPEPEPTAEPEPPKVQLPPLAPISRAPFQKLRLRGTKGGQLTFRVDGDVDTVAGLLMDYDNATGRRAWGRSYRTLSRQPNRVVAQWNFRGRMGINPSVHIEFTRRDLGQAAVITYRVVKKDFGIKSYFGEYRIMPVPGRPGRVLVRLQVFLDSGIPFKGASHKDLEKGLRKDAELIRAWAASKASGR